MKPVMLAALVGLSLALQGCNQAEQQAATPDAAAPAAAVPDPMAGMPMGEPPAGAASHTTTGEVTAVSGNVVTINHAPVAELSWPAMSMAFHAPDAAMIAALAPGTQVRFSFRQDGANYVLTQIEKQ